MAKSGFSFASVVLSYFLVAGGMVLGLIGWAMLKQPTLTHLYAAFAAGAFVGGFVAGRASRGETILEPGLGSLLLVGSVVVMGAATPVGRFMWQVAQDQLGHFAAIVGGASAVGALFGAFLSEKLFGEATTSGIPWILYTALATCGACLVAYMVALAVILRNLQALDNPETTRQGGHAFLAGIAAGCLLSGLAVGTSSRRRVLIASFVGATCGAMGFFFMILHLETRSGQGGGSDASVKGLAYLAASGGLVTLIGNLVGWSLVGKRG